MGGIKRHDAASAASGRFVLRVPAGLHVSMRHAAAEAGLSLNEYCVQRLTAPAGNLAAISGAARVIERAAELFGEQLLAVIAYGSWSRGEAVPSSDVDVLMVLTAGAPVTRELYRKWDSQPLTIEAHEVEPHFVQLKRVDDKTTGVWAEAAIDGIVLFERGLEVSRRLVKVRHDVMAGRLVRRMAHGQPYWCEVA
jgi:predicted nucleotidyltransferase